MLYPKNTAAVHYARLLDKVSGEPIALGPVTVLIVKDNGAQAPVTNAATHKGNGVWSIATIAAEHDCDDGCIDWLHPNSTGYHEVFRTLAYPANYSLLLIDGAGRLQIAGVINTLDALDTAQDIQHSVTHSTVAAIGNAVTPEVAEIKTRIELALPPFAPAAAGGLPTVNATNQVAGVSGSVVGSVGSVTGNLGGNVLGSVNGSIAGSVGSVLGDVSGRILGDSAGVMVGVGVLANNSFDEVIANQSEVEGIATQLINMPASVWLEFDGTQLRKFAELDTGLEAVDILDGSIVELTNTLTQVIEVNGATVIHNLEESRIS